MSILYALIRFYDVKFAENSLFNRKGPEESPELGIYMPTGCYLERAPELTYSVVNTITCEDGVVISKGSVAEIDAEGSRLDENLASLVIERVKHLVKCPVLVQATLPKLLKPADWTECPRCGGPALISSPQVCKDEDFQLQCGRCGYSWLT